MRHAIHLVWLLPFLGAAALGADDLPKPKKDVAPPGNFPDLPAPRPAPGPPDADAAELQRLLRQLRTQRDALRNERGAVERVAEAPAPTTSNEEEIARLRKHMEELSKRGAPRPEPPPPPTRQVEPLPLEGDTPKGGVLDPAAVADRKSVV